MFAKLREVMKEENSITSDGDSSNIYFQDISFTSAVEQKFFV